MAKNGRIKFINHLYKQSDGELYNISHTEAQTLIQTITEEKFKSIISKYFFECEVSIAVAHTYHNMTFENIGKSMNKSKAHMARTYMDIVEKIRDNEEIFNSLINGGDYIPSSDVKTSLSLLGLHTRTLKTLYRLNKYYIEDVASLKVINEVANTKSFGKTCLTDLLNRLDKCGYVLSK